ncbi:MAG: hypothetical protein PVG03_06125 [Desulfarculaceae bacterium]
MKNFLSSRLFFRPCKHLRIASLNSQNRCIFNKMSNFKYLLKYALKNNNTNQHGLIEKTGFAQAKYLRFDQNLLNFKRGEKNICSHAPLKSDSAPKSPTLISLLTSPCSIGANVTVP